MCDISADYSVFYPGRGEESGTSNMRIIVVDRDGEVSGRMVFKVGEKNSFPYETPFGTATLGVKTSRIRQRFDENGGDLEVDYVMDMEHALVTKNKIKLNIRQQIGV